MPQGVFRFKTFDFNEFIIAAAAVLDDDEDDEKGRFLHRIPYPAAFFLLPLHRAVKSNSWLCFSSEPENFDQNNLQFSMN